MVQVIENPVFGYNEKMTALADQRKQDALAQANWLTENQQKQAQEAFLNKDILKQREIAQKAEDAANMGDRSAIAFLKAMSEDNQPQEQSGTFVKNAQGQMVPAQLRAGEVPIMQGQPKDNGALGGIGLNPTMPQMGMPGTGMTGDRLVQSLLKQNPALANNPQALFAAIDRLKPMFPGMDAKSLEQMKTFQELKNATPEGKEALAKAEAAGKKAGTNEGDAASVAGGAKDVLNTYQLLKDSVTKPGSKLPGGALESGLAAAANFLNIPTEGSKEQGAFDANLNNLFLATVRTLKGTGRVMQAEINNIQNAQPKPGDSNAVKLAKLDAHMKYYRNRMQELGFNPDNGEPVSGSAAPAQQNNDPLGLFGQ